MSATPQEVHKAVFLDLRERDLKYAQVADMTGFAKQSVSNQFHSKNYFSDAFSARLCLRFGYNIRYLLCGEESLYPELSVTSLDMNTVSETLGLLLEADCTDAVPLAELAAELGVKKSVLMAFIRKNRERFVTEKPRPDPFGLCGDNPGLLIVDAFSDAYMRERNGKHD